jgi:hypothetical protein
MRRPLRRRGSIYAMVLGITMLITVIGVGALATSRVTARSAAAATDWQEAGCLAFSAVEHAIAKLNADAAASPDTWRNAYTSGKTGFTIPFGNGRMSWTLVDEDNLIADDVADPLKVYGTGRVGKVTRFYSARLTVAGSGIDVLRAAVHASAGIALNGPTAVIDGPASTDGSLSINAGGSLKGNGGSEAVGAGAASKPMPSVAVFGLYKDRATIIPSSVAAGGSMQPGVLSAASNPYGAANAEGIYYLQLPDTVSTLQILSSSIQGTLLIESAAGVGVQTVELRGAMFWQPRADRAAMITKGIQTVAVYGETAACADGNPSELRGLFHLIGTSTVQLNDATYLHGCLVADGNVQTFGSVAVQADPALLRAPPLGYGRGDRVALVPGSWRWDAPPGS